jgi:hypothetical protein
MIRFQIEVNFSSSVCWKDLVEYNLMSFHNFDFF